MKKFLAIVLSIMMVLGVCSVAACAYDESELAVMPEQTENCIYFAAGNVRAEANQTYEIPVYMISNYPTSVQEGYVQLGFEISLSDTNIASIVSVDFDNEIKAVNGFVPLEAYYGYTEDDYINELTYHTNFEKGYVAFAAGLEALNQSKVKVCTVTIATNDAFIGGSQYNKESTPDYVNICLSGYYFNEAAHGNYFDVTGGGIFEGAIPQNLAETNDEVSPAEEITIGDNSIANGIYFVQGTAYKYVNTDPTWDERLIDWLKEQIEQFFQICDTIREYVRAILSLI